MSGELGAYDIVVGNMGDRNDLELWYKGGSLVSPEVAIFLGLVLIVLFILRLKLSQPSVTILLWLFIPLDRSIWTGVRT